MGMGESDTRAKLIDPAIHGRGWTVKKNRYSLWIADPAGHVAMNSGIRRARKPDLILGLDLFGRVAAWIMILIGFYRAYKDVLGSVGYIIRSVL